jgi:hypothetical protein
MTEQSILADRPHEDPSRSVVESCFPPLQTRLREPADSTWPRCGECDDCKFEVWLLDKIKKAEPQPTHWVFRGVDLGG